MALKQVKFVQGTLLGTSESTLHTAGDKVRDRVNLFTATNNTGSEVSVTVWIVKSGDTTGNQHLVLNAKTIDANDSVRIPMANHVLEAGDKISAKAGTADAIAVQVSGTRELVNP